MSGNGVVEKIAVETAHDKCGKAFCDNMAISSVIIQYYKLSWWKNYNPYCSLLIFPVQILFSTSCNKNIRNVISCYDLHIGVRVITSTSLISQSEIFKRKIFKKYFWMNIIFLVIQYPVSKSLKIINCGIE